MGKTVDERLISAVDGQQITKIKTMTKGSPMTIDGRLWLTCDGCLKMVTQSFVHGDCLKAVVEVGCKYLWKKW